MHIAKGLVVGVAGALLVGVLVSVAQNTVVGRVDDSPMTVPVGREGDRVVYAVFGDGQDPSVSAGGDVRFSTGPPVASDLGRTETTQTDTAHAEPRIEVLEVGHVGSMVDATGAPHETVDIAWFDPMGSSTFPFIRHFVDVETRDAVRMDVEFSRAWPGSDFYFLGSYFKGGQGQVDGVNMSFGVDNYYWLQGASLALGDELEPRGVPFMSFLWARGLTGWSDDVDARTWVAERAIVNGTDAYGVRTEVSFVVNEPEATEVWATSGAGGEDRTNRVETPARQWHVQASETAWWSHELPYPILRQIHIVVDGDDQTRDQRYDIVMADYEAGEGRAIPWSPERKEPVYRRINEDAERSAGPHPADGVGSGLAYPLAEAIANVEGDMTLTQFQLWRLQNPSARPVGISYTSAPDAAEVWRHTWHLTYGVFSGDAFQVATQRIQSFAVPINQEMGEQRVTPHRTDDFTRLPITLAAGERLWLRVGDEPYTDAPPRYVEWGLQPDGSRQDALNELRIGVLLEPGLTGTWQTNHSVLRLELDSGNILSYHEFRFGPEGGLLRQGGTLPTADVAIRAKTVPAGVQPPTIEQSALLGTSLLALFLAVYFWPVAKFAAAQGLLILPGYAKLRKDRILENQVRQDLMETIRREPGIHASDLARRVAAGWGTVVHHLAVLEKHDYVSSLVDGRHKRFFPVGTVDWSRRGQFAALRNDTARTIFALIQEEPGIVQGALASRAGVSVPTAIWHLRRLEGSGLVGREKSGRKVHYFANPGDTSVAPEYDADAAVEVA